MPEGARKILAVLTPDELRAWRMTTELLELRRRELELFVRGQAHLWQEYRRKYELPVFVDLDMRTGVIIARVEPAPTSPQEGAEP